MPQYNPWLERHVLAYAHQGGAWEWPSSTLFAMRHAVSAGAHGLELDLHATRDGHIVVCHDPTVDRTTQGSGAIADLTLAELKALDAAYWFVPGADATPGLAPSDYPYRGRAPADPEFTIATLAEVLEAFPDVILNLDIKQGAAIVQPYERGVADALRAFARSQGVIVTSFDDRVTTAFREHAPEVATSAGRGGTAAFFQALVHNEEPPHTDSVAFQVPERYGDVVIVDRRFVEAAHHHDVAVHVWTVNETDSMERLIDLGVDGIISDVPSDLVGVLRARQVQWQPAPLS